MIDLADPRTQPHTCAERHMTLPRSAWYQHTAGKRCAERNWAPLTSSGSVTCVWPQKLNKNEERKEKKVESEKSEPMNLADKDLEGRRRTPITLSPQTPVQVFSYFCVEILSCSDSHSSCLSFGLNPRSLLSTRVLPPAPAPAQTAARDRTRTADSVHSASSCGSVRSADATGAFRRPSRRRATTTTTTTREAVRVRAGARTRRRMRRRRKRRTTKKKRTKTRRRHWDRWHTARHSQRRQRRGHSRCERRRNSAAVARRAHETRR